MPRGSSGDPAAFSVAGDRRAPIKGERHRRAILDALAELLIHRAIGDLTVGEIASAAGVTRSGFYFYFESKYAALAVATGEIWSELSDRVGSFQRIGAESPIEHMRRNIKVGMELWRTREAVLVASVQAAPLDDQLAEQWREWSEIFTAIFVDVIVEDQRAGLAHPVQTNISMLVATLLESSIHMMYRDRLARNNAAQSAEVLETLLAIWEAAVWRT
jgi:AcrR family transcriptional regulator